MRFPERGPAVERGKGLSVSTWKSTGRNMLNKNMSNELSPIEENLNPSSPQDEEEEPLLTVTDVMGWEKPEELEAIPAEKEVDDAIHDNPYDHWVADKSTDNLFAVTKSLQPTIDSVLASMGAAGNPQIAAKARVIAGKAVQSYKPESGASLRTWVTQQLRQLTRDIRKSNNITGVGDRVQLDAYAIHKAETELEDEMGQEPTVQEIADRAHMSVKRIEAVRKQMRPVSTEEAYTEGVNTGIQGQDTDFSQDAMDYVYNDSDRIDRKLLEYTVGYGGHEQLDNVAIKQKLGLNDVQLTRRKQRISLRMKKIMEDLEEVQK